MVNSFFCCHKATNIANRIRIFPSSDPPLLAFPYSLTIVSYII
jgi:hypothetical protein